MFEILLTCSPEKLQYYAEEIAQNLEEEWWMTTLRPL